MIFIKDIFSDLSIKQCVLLSSAFCENINIMIKCALPLNKCTYCTKLCSRNKKKFLFGL